MTDLWQRCRGECGRLFPADIDHFAPIGTLADGVTPRLRRLCRTCDLARARRWDAENPDRVKARQRALYERHKHDPEWLAARRDAHREHWRRKHAVPPEKYRAGASEEEDPLLPPAILQRVLDLSGLTPVGLAGMIGVDNRRVYAMLTAKRGVRMSTLKRAVEAAGLDPVDVDL